MNQPSLFNFKGRDVRTVMIDDQPWFAGADMLTVLFGKAGGNGWAYAMLSPEEQTKVDRTYLGLRPGKQMVVVSESGLYKLVMRSDKPEAKDFQNWVTRVVLPAIRKDGGYIQGEEHVVSGAMSEDELVFKAMEVMKRKIDRLSSENARMEAVINEHLTHMTVGEYREHHHRYWPQSVTSRLSRRAKAICETERVEVTKQQRKLDLGHRVMDTAVNVYPIEILDRAAAELGVFEDA
ncbi:BRO-N domain-containing protein [Sinorhizobium meliloti]|uniref:BRO family protein n=1 Tax=Rhizobium meliloti TaxID=382 RepID=A0AAW9TPA2_RHIML|nr:BRO family protein [Sinorhizobium meliloti]MQW33547.1 BRO family protein [Sinorhizobium meliloti]MQW46121.1 BRO family protein [Sinorhizobium meliloti]